MSLAYRINRIIRFLSLPLSVQWRAYLVRLPWLVPLPVLHWTSPEGPYPIVLQLPSRGPHVIPVYLFFPSEPSDQLSVHLDFHGGGFIMGSCLEQAPFCALIARTTGRLVISVDYRKGPLDQFPAAIEDGEDVLAAVLDEEGRTKAGKMLAEAVSKRYGSKSPTKNSGNVSLSGFSSGGNLALNLVLSVQTERGMWKSLLAEEGKVIPILLFYPSLDCRQLPHERPRPEKMKKHDSNKDTASWFPALGSVLGPTYLPKQDRTHPRASPGLNDMNTALNRRVQIRLILPEIDTLAHQSEVWMRKMKDDGLGERLIIVREEDMPHGWTQFPDAFIDERQRERKYAVLDEAAAWVKDLSNDTIDSGALVEI